MKKVIKFFIIIMITMFLGLFYSYKNGYYYNRNKDKRILTEEKIREYEEDIKNGIDISNKDYITLIDNYDNNYTRGFLNVSHKIEKGFDMVIKYFFRIVGKTINE